MSMNRHYREQHRMFDPRIDSTKSEASSERGEKAEHDDSGNSDTSPRNKRRKQKQAATPRKAVKTAQGKTPHIKTEEGKEERHTPPATPRTRQKMSDHSTSKTWQEHAHLQRNAPTTPVWQQVPSSNLSAYSSSSSSSSSTPSSDHIFAASPATTPTSSHNVTRTRLSSIVYPYNLMSAMRDFGGFLGHFVRLNWNLLARQVQALSQTNDLGRLVAQVHMHNTHRHTVRFQTAAGLISDNDGACPARCGETETATRIRGVQYEVAMECRDCNRRRMDVLLVGRHYVLTDDMEVREMTLDEYAADQQRTGYRLPHNPAHVGVMTLEGDQFEELRAEMEARYAQWYTAHGMRPPASRN